MFRTRYILIGGFLGAGKTTAILRIAEKLAARGQRVGLITNDQSVGLADTTLLSNRGFPAAEVTGGCFCCKFNSVMEAADRLTEKSCPEVFIAEPVGSCTDLKATVSYPLRRLHGDRYRVAPLSVLDRSVASAVDSGVGHRQLFCAKVHYIYLKQLEEAEVIVVNKCDLLDPVRLQQLEDALKARFPNRSVVRISAKAGAWSSGWT